MSSSHPLAPSSSSARSPTASAAARAAETRSAVAANAATAAAAAAADNENKPSLRARLSRFFARDGPGGLTFGAWACVAAATLAVALASWQDQRLQEKEKEVKRESLTSSSQDWRNAKQEAKEAARDARSAASKWAKGQ